MATVAVAARVRPDTARSLRRIAVLGGCTVSRVIATIVEENVPPLAAELALTPDRQGSGE